MIKKIKEYDKSFDKTIFLSRIDHIFIMLLSSIMDKNLTNVKHYLSNDVYKKFKELVDTYKNENKTRLFDEMNIKDSTINDVNISDNKINITTKIITRYMDYFIDSNGNFIEGTNTHRIEKTHTVIFSKRLDASELKNTRRCPNCGYSLDINNSGICPYCKGIFNTEKYDYIVSKMDLF